MESGDSAKETEVSNRPNQSTEPRLFAALEEEWKREDEWSEQNGILAVLFRGIWGGIGGLFRK